MKIEMLRELLHVTQDDTAQRSKIHVSNNNKLMTLCSVFVATVITSMGYDHNRESPRLG